MKKLGKRTVSVISALVLVLQMMLVSGVTAFADSETPIVPITDPKVNINGINLILDGEIGLVYHVYVPEEYLDGYVTLSCRDDTVRTDIKDCTDLDKNLRYMFTYHLSAIDLSEQVCITVYDKNGAELAAMSRSAEDYAKLLRNSAKATDAEKKVAETLINYGHYAQLACAEANGWVIGEDHAGTTAFYAPTADTSVFSDYAVNLTGNSAELGDLSMSLSLDYKTSILLYVPAEEKPTVKVNGQITEAVPSGRIENTYEIEIAGINALNLDEVYTVEIGDVTINLCAFSYCRQSVRHNISPNTVDAMRALYEFFDATEKYLNPTTESEVIK